MIENINPTDLQTALFTVGTFVAIGAGTNYSQYQQKVENTPEKWRFDKALPALAKGAIAGLVAYFIGLPPEATAIAGVLGGVIPIYEQIHHGSLTFREVFSIAQKGGASPAASARKGGEAAYDEMDMGEIHRSYREVQRVAEEHGEYRDPDEIKEGVPEEVDLDRRAALGLKPRASADDIVTEGG